MIYLAVDLNCHFTGNGGKVPVCHGLDRDDLGGHRPVDAALLLNGAIAIASVVGDSAQHQRRLRLALTQHVLELINVRGLVVIFDVPALGHAQLVAHFVSGIHQRLHKQDSLTLKVARNHHHPAWHVLGIELGVALHALRPVHFGTGRVAQLPARAALDDVLRRQDAASELHQAVLHLHFPHAQLFHDLWILKSN
jgi:hypothetical protein